MWASPQYGVRPTSFLSFIGARDGGAHGQGVRVQAGGQRQGVGGFGHGGPSGRIKEKRSKSKAQKMGLALIPLGHHAMNQGAK